MRPAAAVAVRQAFSPRRNLRLLFVPGESRLRAVDGLRAIAILAAVMFHAAFYAGEFVTPLTYLRLLYSPWMLPLWRGHFGVDMFFVLSGFLIAGMLIDERERTGRIRLGLFYARRLLRLWPALLVAVAAYATLLHDDDTMLWASALYVGNFVPVLDGAMGWTWSLAIEEHFYLVCPWLLDGLFALRPSARLAAVIAIAAAVCGVGASIVVAGGYHAFDGEVVLNRDFGLWARAYDALYDKPWMRVGPLLMGVAAAIVFRMPRAMAALSRARLLGVVGLVVALCIGGAATHWPLVAFAPRAVEVGYLATYRTVFGAAVAYVLLFALSTHPVGAALGRVLAARALYPVAQLAYSAYLVNPIVTRLAERALSAAVNKAGVPPMWVFLPVSVVGTFVVAGLVYVLVERPFMELRPRADTALPVTQRSSWRHAVVRLAVIALLAVVLPWGLAVGLPRFAEDDLHAGVQGAEPRTACPELAVADPWHSHVGARSLAERGTLVGCVHAATFSRREVAYNGYYAQVARREPPTNGYDLYVIQYVSEGRPGEARALSALLYLPSGGATDVPLVAVDHGASGIGPGCGPSHVPPLTDPMAIPLVGRGYAVIAPDYAGMGVDDAMTSYLVGTAEAAATLDGVSAVRQLHDLRFDASQLSPGFFVVGHSQGAHAALFAHARASVAGAGPSTGAGVTVGAGADRLLGSVAFAPAIGDAREWRRRLRDPARRLGLLEIGELLTFYSHAARTGVPPDAWLAPGAQRSLPAILHDDCFGGLASALDTHFGTVGALYQPALLAAAASCPADGAPCPALEPWSSMLEAEQPGDIASVAPSLILEGLADDVVSPSSVACIADRMRARHTPVEVCAYAGVDHFRVVTQSMPDVLRWLAARRDGQTLRVCRMPLQARCDAGSATP